MKIQEVREIEATALAAKLKEAGEEMFHLRMKHAMGQTETLKKLRELRKDRARMATVIRERELSAQKGTK